MSGEHEQIMFHDVFETPIIGRLDETINAEMKSDAARIRTYIRAEKEAASSAPGRTPPSIARAVLTSVWEAPRIGFHGDALADAGFPKGHFSNKLLLIPWSIEAFEQWRSTLSVTGLILEHVTPIDWMWQELKNLDNAPDGDGLKEQEEWQDDAATYLFHHYMLAVLTRKQANAIDATGLKKIGVERNPFLRYRAAEYRMNIKRAKDSGIPNFSTKRFVIPGPRPRE